MAKPKRNKTSSLIPQSAAKVDEKNSFLNHNVAKLDGWKQSGNEANIFVSLRFIHFDTQCFSDWGKHDMKAFWAFQEKLSSHTWQQVYGQAKKGEGKTGFAYTVIDKSQYPDSEFKKNLSDDITLFELRVDGEKRIHGYRRDSIFYAFWLDKDHNLLKK